jgi:carbonic anhydrase
MVNDVSRQTSLKGPAGARIVFLIHHTDCGMLTFTDDGFKRSIQEETGIKPPVVRRGVC